MRERHTLPRRDDRSGSRSVTRSASRSRSRSSSRVSTHRDRIRCYKCREYNHFASECPYGVTDEEPDWYDSDSQSVLQILAHDNLERSSSSEAINHLNI